VIIDNGAGEIMLKNEYEEARGNQTDVG